MVLELLGAALGTFVALLPIANPFSTAAVFVAVTKRFTEEQARDQARRACLYMAVVLLISLFAGALEIPKNCITIYRLL
ncbi:MAG: MarC family protein [Verrucomicrobiota bacterium]